MTETINKKPVNTLLDRDLWKKAQFNDINWARALELGVTILLGGDKEEKDLRSDRIELRGKIKYVEKRLQEIEHMKENKTTIEDIIYSKKTRQGSSLSRGGSNTINCHGGTPLEFLKNTMGILKRNKGALTPRTNNWNKITNMELSQNEFLALCRRAQLGEFDNNGQVQARKGGKK